MDVIVTKYHTGKPHSFCRKGFYCTSIQSLLFFVCCFTKGSVYSQHCHPRMKDDRGKVHNECFEESRTYFLEISNRWLKKPRYCSCLATRVIMARISSKYLLIDPLRLPEREQWLS